MEEEEKLRKSQYSTLPKINGPKYIRALAFVCLFVYLVYLSDICGVFFAVLQDKVEQ